MNTMLLMSVGVALAVVCLALVVGAKHAKRGPLKGGRIDARTPLTKYEQPMFFRLRETFPEHVVLAQVAFSALLTSKDKGARNTFDRKVADFVICSKAFEVLSLIELDDSSHKTKAAADAARDEMLKSAGYKVLRFKTTPDVETLRKAVLTPEATT